MAVSLTQSRAETDEQHAFSCADYSALCCSGSQLRAALLPLVEYLATSGGIFGCQTGGMLLASSGWSPEIQLNILQCRGNAMIKNHPAQNVNSAKAEKPCSTSTFDIPPTL